MKIWFVQSAPQGMLGGGETFAVRLAAWLKRRGHTVRFVVRPDSRLARAAGAVWLDVRTLPMRNDFDFLSRRRLVRWLAADRPEVVFGAYGRDIKLTGAAALKAGAQLYWLQGIPLADGSRTHRRLDAKFVRGYIVPSRYMKEEIGRRGGIAAEKIAVVHPALDPRPFEPDQLVADQGDRYRRGHDIPLAAPVAVCPARLIAGKGQRVLLAAWVEVLLALPDAFLLIVGDGPDGPVLKAEAARLGLTHRVRFTGHLEDVRPAMWIADLLVLPTLSDSFPVVVLEAMASGLAVVASRVGGIPEQIEEGRSGILVPPGDAAALADAVRRVLADEKLRHDLVEEGRRRVLQFTADVCFPPLEALISGVRGPGVACT